MLGFLSSWLNETEQASLSKILKEDLHCTYFLNTNCHAILKLFWKMSGL